MTTGRRTTRWLLSRRTAYLPDAPSMPLHIAVLQDRFRAAVLGFAIGDALGFPYRGLPAPALMRQQPSATTSLPARAVGSPGASSATTPR